MVRRTSRLHSPLFSWSGFLDVGQILLVNRCWKLVRGASPSAHFPATVYRGDLQCEWQVASRHPTTEIVGTGWITCIVLIISLLIHELAHVFAINNLGGEVKSISLVPWGGNSDFVYPSSTGSRAIVHMAGPFVSGFIFVIGAMLLLQTANRDLISIINPFSPNGFDANDWERSLMTIVTWVNFQIFIVNLIPCFPFDGSNILRAVFESINSELSRVKIETTIMAIGHLVAVAMIGVALLLPPTAYNSPIETLGRS